MTIKELQEAQKIMGSIQEYDRYVNACCEAKKFRVEFWDESEQSTIICRDNELFKIIVDDVQQYCASKLVKLRKEFGNI